MLARAHTAGLIWSWAGTAYRSRSDPGGEAEYEVIDALFGKRHDSVRAMAEVACDDELVDPPVGQLCREPFGRAGGSEQSFYLAGNTQRLDMDAAGRSGQLGCHGRSDRITADSARRAYAGMSAGGSCGGTLRPIRARGMATA
jgi:hypothetical protein